MPATLCDLPVELFDAIIDQLSGADPELQQLRLVCRTIQTKTRIRFGEETFQSFIVSPLPHCSIKLIDSILRDDVFRHSLREIEICIDNPNYAEGYELVDWEALHVDLAEGYFEQDLRFMLELAPGIRRLVLTSPMVPHYDPTESSRVASDLAWYMLLHKILMVIFTMPGLQLECLEIGDFGSFNTVTSLHFLKGIPLNSPALACLKTLSLSRTCGATYFLPSSLPSPQQSTQTLADFLTLLPNLKCFEFSGDGLDYPNFFHVAPGLPSLPALTNLELSDISITDTALLQGLQSFCMTLKDVNLVAVKLKSGIWRPILIFLRHKLHLDSLGLHSLSVVDRSVCFDVISRDRPLVVDSELSADWTMAGYGAPPDDDSVDWARKLESHAQGIEVAKLLEDDWVWVVHQEYKLYQITLSVESGDDMDMWLDRVIKEHKWKWL